MRRSNSPASGSFSGRRAMLQKSPAHSGAVLQAETGGLTPGEDQAGVVWQRGHERLSDPCIRQAKDLVVVEHEHDAFAEAAQPRRQAAERFDPRAQEQSDRVHHAALGGLDAAAVEAEQCGDRSRRARRMKASSSVDLPTPPMPWM